jgi:hypothetical protein
MNDFATHMQQSGGNLRCADVQQSLRHPNLQFKRRCRHPVDRTFRDIPGLVPRSFTDTTERARTADTRARRRATSNRNGGANAYAGCGTTGSADRSARRNSRRRHNATGNSCASCACRTRAPHHHRCRPVTSGDASR